MYCTHPGLCLERGVGVDEQLLKVGLEPLAGLRGRLHGIGTAAEVVVAGSRGVAGTVALATGLDPDKGVGEFEAGVGGGADAESGTCVKEQLAFDFTLHGE